MLNITKRHLVWASFFHKLLVWSRKIVLMFRHHHFRFSGREENNRHFTLHLNMFHNIPGL